MSGEAVKGRSETISILGAVVKRGGSFQGRVEVTTPDGQASALVSDDLSEADADAWVKAKAREVADLAQKLAADRGVLSSAVEY